MTSFAKSLTALNEQNNSFVLVTLINIKGSAPQVIGAKMLVTSEGLYWGTVGGGKIEAHCIRHAKNLLQHKAGAETQTWNLQKDIGMSCGGEVSLFFDVTLVDSWHISIFGAGHISQELCRVLQTWSCQVSVFDTRADWLEKLPSAENINKKLSASLAQEVLTLPQKSFLLCMTMGHATDLPILMEAYKKFEIFSLVGVIGSDIKAEKIKKELLESGANSSQVSQLASPLGLPIGNNTPSEIAISICALLLAKRDQRSFTVENGFVTDL